MYELGDVINVDEMVLDVSWGFLGGAWLQGLTCGALTSGVFVIGLKFGDIEDSHVRVLEWLGRQIVGASPMRDDVNKFNRAISTGNRLVLWLEEEFGST